MSADEQAFSQKPAIAIVVILCALPLLMVALLVHLDLFASPGPGPVALYRLWWIVPLALFQGFAAARYLLAENRVALLWSLVVLLVCGLAGSILGGIFLHQDFFSVQFMVVIQVIILALGRYRSLMSARGDTVLRNRLLAFAFAASCLWSIWILLMCYVLVTRQEPRMGEVLFYNAYNILLAVGLYVVTYYLSLQAWRTISISSETFIVDGLDFTPVIGLAGHRIVRGLIGTNEALGCRELQTSPLPERCVTCSAGHFATCTQFRTMNAALRQVQRTLEALQVGTIVPRDGRWLYVPANRVRIIRQD